MAGETVAAGRHGVNAVASAPVVPGTPEAGRHEARRPCINVAFTYVTPMSAEMTNRVSRLAPADLTLKNGVAISVIGSAAMRASAAASSACHVRIIVSAKSRGREFFEIVARAGNKYHGISRGRNTIGDMY